MDAETEHVLYGANSKDVARIIKEQFIPYVASQNFGLISLGPPI